MTTTTTRKSGTIAITKLSTLTQSERKRLIDRTKVDISAVKASVEKMIATVKEKGDQALVAFTKEYDDPNFTQSRLKVTAADTEKAYKQTDKDVIEKIKEQVSLTHKFHSKQKEQIRSWETQLEDGIVAGEKWTPIANAGLYVPGGKNPFPTVQQILAVPAKIAGCKRIASCISPRGDNFEVLIAAQESGISEIYRVSGAQAIAALAYGTETIAPVDIIVGPGSPYVTAAKILCQEKVAIDMPAGPSEVAIIADGSESMIDLQTKACYCAADLLAQAEHGPDSAVVLITDSPELAKLTQKEVELQYKQLSRQEYIDACLKTYSLIVLVRNLDEAIDFANEYAPEHLEILTENPKQLLARIENAGSVFLGDYNPVPVGDYATGVNHTLPASGWARQASALGVWTFMKRVQYSQLTKAGLETLRPIVQTISAVEGLDGHRFSVDCRFAAKP